MTQARDIYQHIVGGGARVFPPIIILVFAIDFEAIAPKRVSNALAGLIKCRLGARGGVCGRKNHPTNQAPQSSTPVRQSQFPSSARVVGPNQFAEAGRCGLLGSHSGLASAFATASVSAK